MDAGLSKGRVLGYLLISLCFVVLLSASADAATKIYTCSINTAASTVYWNGGYAGDSGVMSVSGTFQAVMIDGVVVEFRKVNLYPSDFMTARIIPSYPGTVTQAGSSYSFSGSKPYDNSSGGGAFNGSINGAGFSLIGNFQAPCCDQYNYEFYLNGVVVPGVDSTGNNFTMLDASGTLFGGTNDVHYTWDGTLKTSVATSGQVSNATLASPCPFVGSTWSAHDIAIYGPGTYTVYTLCAAGSPGCGLSDWGNPPITFTVNGGEIGGHILLDWNGTINLDIVNVWQSKAVFGPSAMWTGACGSNPTAKVWDWMSRDVNGDGINGYPMITSEPSSPGMQPNFNLMETTNCDDGNACTNDDWVPTTGCVHTPVSCNDNNACTTDTCNPAIGCVYSAINCNDNNTCTIDTCDRATGCAHITIDCNAVGTITTVAGIGTSGYAGDNGPAVSARLNDPNSVAVDSSGNIFIADRNNHRIRKVDTSGIITTVAGNGTYGYSGDNGPATSARLWSPLGIAVDSSGNLYIADTDNNRIRKVDTSGIITTVAGNGTYGYSGDNGPATLASFKYPYGIAPDLSGNIFIADRLNHRIRKVNTGGIITTVAGNGTWGYSGDNGPATSAKLDTPSGVAVSSLGNLYIADQNNHRIRMVDTVGTITTVAGYGTAGYSGDGGPATSAQLYYPTGVAVDTSGTLYIADNSNVRIRRVDAGGTIISVAGNGTLGYSGDNGPAINAGLYWPSDVAVDLTGSIYIADSNNHRIRRVTWPIVTCAELPEGTSCNDNNTCTTNDVCTNGTCLGTAVVCDDNNACTTDSCDAASGACVHMPVTCHDSNLCTDDSCDPAVGCIFRQISCPTGMDCDPAIGNCAGCIGPCMPCTTDSQCGSNNACVTNTCVAGYCSTTLVRCNDNNACTTDSCNPVSGECQHTPRNCDDGTSCTNDSCVSGTCLHAPISGCDQNCAGKPNGTPCDDNNACTVNETCSGGVCAGTPKCDDGNVCTYDFCNSFGQCGHVTNSGACDDNNACTYDSCDPVTGCIHTPINCNDNNACTADTCNAATGCVHTPIVCNDGNACTIDTCNPATGCVHTPISCTITSVCFEDVYLCNPATGCIFIPKDCNDDNACTFDYCTDHEVISGCKHLPITCNDNNACTTDSCNPTTGCAYTPVQCPLGYLCDPATGNCVNPDPCAGVKCDDNNTCTTDACNAAVGACVYTQVADGTACTVNIQPGTCTFGQCIPYPVCPAGSVKSATIRGGGQKPNSVDLQIQTNFTVVNGGCIAGYTDSTVTCTPGTNLLVDVKAGKGPMPTSCTWKGAPISTDSLLTIACPAVSGDVGKLICDNKLSGGKDVDKMTITVP